MKYNIDIILAVLFGGLIVYAFTEEFSFWGISIAFVLAFFVGAGIATVFKRLGW